MYKVKSESLERFVDILLRNEFLRNAFLMLRAFYKRNEASRQNKYIQRVFEHIIEFNEYHRIQAGEAFKRRIAVKNYTKTDLKVRPKIKRRRSVFE